MNNEAKHVTINESTSLLATLVVTVLCTLAVLVGFDYYTRHSQLICAVNESNFLLDGWQPLQEADRARYAIRHANGDIEIRAIPNAVACTWNKQDVPTTGALWYWRPVHRYAKHQETATDAVAQLVKE